MGELPSGTVTLLFSDVEGSTRLLRELAGDYARALADQRRLLRDAFARHNGREVDAPGDGFLVAFGRARDAVAAAAEAQRALAAHDWPQRAAMRVRMGIHTGEPAQADGGYVGLDLHRAARICSAAHGGQVLVSATTRDLLDDADFVDLGEHLLKDLPSPERLFQLAADGLASEFPPPRAVAAQSLPVKATRLVGRDREVGEVSALLERNDVRVVTCTGVGGIGKTRLALEVAAAVAPSFEDGAVFVPLAPVTDAPLVVPAIAAALRLRPSGVERLADQVAEYLRRRALVLVLDNFEQVAAAAPAIAELLEQAPHVKVLATARAPLHISGEHDYAVHPLPEGDAVGLFTDRAIAAGTRLDTAAHATIAEICRRLDGLPLAIELAAARTKLLAPEELLGRLSQRLAVLTAGPRDLPERQRTLRATLDWSHDLLDSAERRLFGEIAVFVGGATLDAVEAVCRCDDALAGVATLVDNNLVYRVDAGGHARFAMLETVREYALEKLDERADDNEVRERHAHYFADLAERAEAALTGPDQGAWLARLAAEHDNLRAALDRLLTTGDVERALRADSALVRYWRAHGHAAEARLRLDRALRADVAVEPAVRAQALWAGGRLAMAQSDFDAAARAYEEARALFRATGDVRRESFAVAELGMIAFERGELERAEQLCEESLALARRIGDARATSAALTNLANVASEQSDHDRARRLFEESLSLRRELGDALLVANTALNLGLAALAARDFAGARRAAEECLTIARELGDLLHTAAALCTLGEAELFDSDLASAAEHLRDSLALYVRLRENRGTIESLNALAAVAAADGNAERAARLWGAVEARRIELGVGVLHEIELELGLRLVPEAVRTLGEERFDHARAAGRALSLGEAVDEALAT